MSTSTTRLGLVKPAGTEDYDVGIVNTNSDKLDAAAGATPCTSGTRPSVPFPGQVIHESDTGELLVRNAANSAWVSLGALAATGNTLARRDTGGVLTVATATAAGHATTKAQLDAAVAPGAWTTWTPATNWVSYVGAGPGVTTGPYETFSYRLEPGKRVHVRGWLNSTAAIAAGAALTAALPVGLRPPKGIILWPIKEGGTNIGEPTRCELYTDGVLYTSRAISSASFYNFDQMSFYVP